MKKSNRGFSFVELLATIVIMGLLSGLAIVSIRFLTNKAEKEYYKAQESEIVMAAKSYTQDNRNYLPKRVGFKKQIYLKTLQDKKYIGDVVDRGKKKCDPTKSYVQVYRYDKNHYNYVVNLVCNSYKSMDNDDSNITEKPTVKINFLNVSKDDKYSDAKVNLVIEDDNKISSYSYIIIKDGEEVKNSGDIDGKLQTKIDTNISLADYVPGKITVKAVATNTFGNQGNDSKSVTVKNENAPTCEVIRDNSVKDVNGNPTCEGRWIKDPTQATLEAQVKCIDKSGSGCQKDVYTQVFFGERKTDFISMADNTGNTAPCEVYVCIDVTKPTTPVIDNPYEGVWINKSYSIKISSYDKTAGIAYFEYRYPDSTGVDGNGVSEKEWHQWANSSKDPGDTTPFVTTPFSKERDEYVEVRACDRAGNCSDIARSKIRIDKTDPTCTIAKNKANPDGLNDWYVTNVNLTLNRNDVNGSGDRAVNSPISYELKNTNSASYNGTTTGTQKDTKGITWYGFIKDEAGNKTSCNSGSFKVDTTKPDKPSITNRNDNKWVNKSYTISVVSKDATSGIDYFAYRYPSSNSPGENTWNKYANSSRNPGDNTAFTTTNFSKERDENVEIKVCDRAGNCSDTAKSMIKIDKTAPTCTIAKNKANPDGLNDWYVTNVNLTLNRNDVNGSGDRAVNSPISYELKNTNSASYNGTTTGTQKDTKGITWYGFIKDEAGNKTSCNSGSFKVDTTKPDKPSITNRNDNKWVNKSYTISVVSKDATSGIDYFAYRYPSSNSPGENTWNKYANSSRNPGDNTPFTTTKFSKERGEDVNIKACDLAGNCSDVSVSTIKIDKTAPTITPKYSLVTIGSISEENVTDLFTIKYSKSSGSVKCNVSKTANIKASHNPLTCTVTGGSGLTASATIPIKNPLVSIAVTKNPNKMEYRLGDAFDKKGMVVTATYRDGTTKAVKDYTLSVDIRENDSRRNPRPGGYDINYFSPERIDHIKKINVSYTEDGVTATTDFNVYSYLYTDQIVKYVVVPWKYQVHDISNRPTMWTETQWFDEYEGYLYFDSSYKNNPYGCKYEIGSNYFKITSTNSSYLCRISYEVFALAKDGSYWDAGYFEKDENYVFSRTSNAVHNTYGNMTWISNIDNDGRPDTSQNYTASIDTLRPRFDMGVACNRGTCTITQTMNSVTVSGKPVPIVTTDLDS